ncbi:MAG: phosphotransferase [Aquabacterium sp.]|uniref:phosphotransferase family protein n=1 Tax=Aquabacterium sp. TaxID=1872578 RepID=UPI0027224C32|nr:phosphotransferase [Aquabacterium sp.]MDO9006066.1 phosphotransferase [Aquabacterium sp.]
MDKGETTLVETLTALIAQHMSEPPLRRLRGGLQLRPGAAQQASPAQIAKELVQQALASDLPLRNLRVEQRPLGGGNTAETVAQLTLHAPFVLKLDSKPKLAAEAHMMDNARKHPKLSPQSRNAWPVVYAIRDVVPYAYLMEYFPSEDGWVSLEDRLYPGPGVPPLPGAEAIRLTHKVLDVLFESYADTVDNRTLPSLAQDYVGRIKERLADVAKDGRFASIPLLINGETIEPWQTYLDQLQANPGYISTITPPFTTIAHGDPNPGNLMLRVDIASIEVKLIDPKEWQTGDYLFDVAKLTHFLEGTGPIEKPGSGKETEVEYIEHLGTAELRYRFEVPTWTNGLVDACLDRVGRFAKSQGDHQWLARYELAMAANLLGLPSGRLKNRPHAALALYGEGLKWLKRFCSRLPRITSVMDPRPTASALSEVEPARLASARQRVRADAPGVVDAVDKRGFQALHWPPEHVNAAGKPVELSLEHEARLMPLSPSALQKLKDALAASGSMERGNALLPGHPLFGDWSIRRVQREPGPQSRDLYWDRKGSTVEQRLIPRMMTLRERVMTSAFMTWESNGDERSLNLELPFVSYAQTGVIARLEFNWIDRIAATLEAFNGSGGHQGSSSQPLVLAARIAGIEGGEFEPVQEHTTFREKHSVRLGDAELFQLNIDHVVAQSLRTQRLATFTDVDIAASRLVHSDVLAELIAFAAALCERFTLVPAAATKAYCGAMATGEL